MEIVDKKDLLSKYKSTIYNAIRQRKMVTKSYEKDYDNIYKDILYYLDTDPDMLCFDASKSWMMKYIIKKGADKHMLPNQIPLLVNSQYYTRLVMFDYIGLKFYRHEIEEVDVI